MTQRHVTVSEAGRILGVSRRTIQRRISAGELPTVEVGGGGSGLSVAILRGPPYNAGRGLSGSRMHMS